MGLREYAARAGNVAGSFVREFPLFSVFGACNLYFVGTYLCKGDFSEAAGYAVVGSMGALVVESLRQREIQLRRDWHDIREITRLRKRVSELTQRNL
jgi:hypothetical protein